MSIVRPRSQALGLALAGVGLVVSGVVIWRLIAEARSARAALPTDFAAIPAEVNFEAPELTLSDANGEVHSLSDFRGQVVLVNLWATWCPPCEAEMPIFQRFYEKHVHEGFVVVAVNDGEPAADVEAFVAEYGLTFPVWLDPEYEATERAFRAANLPTSYVIDRTGTVRSMWIGAISGSNLEKHVAPLIKE